MNHRTSYYLCLALLLAAPLTGAADMGQFLKAQALLGQISQIVDKYQDVQALLDNGELSLPVVEPRDDAEGEFVLPFTSTGLITEWADMALSAQAGARVGEMAAGRATEAIASRVPLGGLLGGALRGKSREIAAVTAIGGWDYIRATSDASFDKMEDLSLYLHVEYAGTADYETALAAAMAIYPALEKNHQRTIDRAYRDARREARRR